MKPDRFAAAGAAKMRAVRRGAAGAFVALALALPAQADSPGLGLRHGEAPATVWAVGDGADGSAEAIEVAELIERGQPDRFLYLGDVYEDGTASEFATNYAPVYGRFDQIAAPTPGNHEWGNREQGYYPYWRAAKGASIPDWYAFRVAGWELISLNSEAEHEAGSPQVKWLRQQVRKSRGVGTCRIAFWHRPRYSAGRGGDQVDMEPFWRQLARNATLVLNGHNHDMQRHLRRRGIVELVAGSGGHEPRDVDETDPRLGFAADGVQGALRLVLRRRSASYAFVSTDGSVLDEGKLPCRRRR